MTFQIDLKKNSIAYLPQSGIDMSREKMGKYRTMLGSWKTVGMHHIPLLRLLSSRCVFVA